MAGLVDRYTDSVLRTTYNSHKAYVETLNGIRRDTGLPIRGPNPPEDITENITKFILRNKYGDTTCVWAKSVGRSGDLYSDREGIQEVKAFSSEGPSSFGPDKIFKAIYFLDMRGWLQDKIILWRISVTNESREWKGLRMNNRETYEDQCIRGVRPHISFEKIIEQLGNAQDSSGNPICSKIYDGTFEGIF
jgi:hypothetical protein